MNRNGSAARAANDPELLVATLCRSTPRELLEVATKLQRRSSDHAAVLHDSLYAAATQRRPVSRAPRAKSRSRTRVPSLKAAMRAFPRPAVSRRKKAG